MIVEDRKIREKIIYIWKDWKLLERTSRRPERESKPTFIKKQDMFVNQGQDMPPNILLQDYETVLKNDSGRRTSRIFTTSYIGSKWSKWRQVMNLI